MGKKSYIVGYGKPPLGSRYPQGKSGNPKGRPKGSKNLLSLTKTIAEEQVTITINGVTQKMSNFEAALRQLYGLATAGSIKHLDKVIEFAKQHEAIEDEGLLKEEQSSYNSITPSEAARAYQELQARVREQIKNESPEETQKKMEKILGRPQHPNESDVEYASQAYTTLIRKGREK